MNKEIAQYINTLLADRERLLDEREEGSEDWDSLKEETKSELANIYQAQKAIKFVEDIWDADCPRICIENPVGALTKHSKLGRATQYIQPYEFNHAEQKRTGLC